MMNNFEKIKNMTLDEMIDLFVAIETHFDVVDIDRNGIKQWLQQESEG